MYHLPRKYKADSALRTPLATHSRLPCATPSRAALGTFFLVIVGMKVGAFTTSLLLAALTSMGASISLAHYNPAITMAYMLRSNVSWKDGLWMIFFQTLGATFAAIAFDACACQPASRTCIKHRPASITHMHVPAFISASLHQYSSVASPSRFPPLTALT